MYFCYVYGRIERGFQILVEWCGVWVFLICMLVGQQTAKQPELAFLCR